MATTSELLQALNESAAANTAAINTLTAQMAAELPSGLGNLVTGEKLAAAGMPSGVAVEVSIPDSGGTFVAPVTGWLVWAHVSRGPGEFVFARSSEVVKRVVGAGEELDLVIPVVKGRVVSVTYNASGDVRRFYVVKSIAVE